MSKIDGGVSIGFLDDRYLKLDCSNGPLTAPLEILSTYVEQLKISFNAAHYMAFTVDGKGEALIECTYGEIGFGSDTIKTQGDIKVTLEGSSFICGANDEGKFYVKPGGNDVWLQNTYQDADLTLAVNQGGATRTITWDASADKLKHDAGTFDFDDDNLTTTGNISGVNVTSGSDPGHTHTGASLSNIDISADTNLAVTSPIVLTDDTLSFDFTTTNTWTGVNTFDNYMIIDQNDVSNYTRIGPSPTHITPSTTRDMFVVTKASNSTSTCRPCLIVLDYDETSNTSSPQFGLNSFVYQTSASSGNQTNSKYGFCGGNYAARLYGSGNVTWAGGVSSGVYVDTGYGGTLTNGYGYIVKSNQVKNSIVGKIYGYYMGDVSTSGDGQVTTQYGFYCEELNGAGNNYGGWFEADMEWFFRDTAIHIGSLDDGHLDLTADVSIDLNANTIVTGYVDASAGFKDNGHAGIDGSFVDTDGNTVTVSGGIIIAITPPK